jgi:hypothetical protein
MDNTSRPWAIAGLGDAAFAALAEDMAPSELWSLLLSVMERRSMTRTAAAVRQQWENDRFVRPAPIDQRTLQEMDGHLLEAARDFEARGTEVVSDPTNILALVSAQRLRKNARQVVRLTTCHRCVRAQDFPKLPGFEAHFRMFCMTTAGHESKDRMFLTTALVEHIETHLGALDRLEMHGYDFGERHLRILATPANEPLAGRIARAIRSVPVSRAPLTHSYYDGLRFRIDVGRSPDAVFPLVDGGAFNWLRKLTSNNKLSFIASGMGSQLAACVFRT